MCHLLGALRRTWHRKTNYGRSGFCWPGPTRRRATPTALRSRTRDGTPAPSTADNCAPACGGVPPVPKELSGTAGAWRGFRRHGALPIRRRRRCSRSARTTTTRVAQHLDFAKFGWDRAARWRRSLGPHLAYPRRFPPLLGARRPPVHRRPPSPARPRRPFPSSPASWRSRSTS